MKAQAQVTTTAKTATASAAVRNPQPAAAVPEQEAERPDIATQLEGASRLGHSFAALGVGGAEPPPPIQAKLLVGPVGDRYEREADRVAELVTRMPRPSPGTRGAGSDIQRQEENEQDEQRVQMTPVAASITPLGRPHRAEQGKAVPGKSGGQPGPQDSSEAGPGIERRLAARQGRGQPLPGQVRAYMEPRFGADFSGVRLHTQSEAAQMSRRLAARAFTYGRDIYLGQGQPDPASQDGKRLLAHELTHTIQQGAVPIKPQAQPNLSPLISGPPGMADTMVQRNGLWSTLWKNFRAKRKGYSKVPSEPEGQGEGERSGPSPPDYLSEEEVSKLIKQLAELIAVLSSEYAKGDVEVVSKNLEARKNQFSKLMDEVGGEGGEEETEPEPEGAAGKMETEVEGFAGAKAEAGSKEEEAPFELEMQFKKVEISKEASRVASRTAEGQIGPAKGKAEFQAGAGAKAGASASIGTGGVEVKGSAEFFVGAKLEAEGTLDLTRGGSGVVLSGNTKFQLGAAGEIEGKLGINPRGLEASIKGGALLGLKGEAEATVTLRIFRRPVIGVKGKVTGTVGLGAGAQGQLKFDIASGELQLGFSAEATMGVGGGAGVELSVNQRNIYLVTKEAAARAVSRGASGFESLDIRELDERLQYKAMITVLEREKARLEQRKTQVKENPEKASLLFPRGYRR